MELFRKEINQRRNEAKYVISLQIDASFGTSMDGLLEHAINFMSNVKPNTSETNKQKSASTFGQTTGGKWQALQC